MDIFRRNRYPQQYMLYKMTDKHTSVLFNTKCKQKHSDIKVGLLSRNEIIIKIINKQPDYSYTIKPMLQ